MILEDTLPSIYHSIIPSLLDIEYPAETIATCNTCTYCRHSQSPYIGTKCCWFYPKLPNFIIGAILANEHEGLALGSRLVRAQIKARAGILPYGTVPPLFHYRLRKKIVVQDTRLRSAKSIESLRCPYHDQGNCSIWEYRNSTCATYFCTSIGGKSGLRFWEKIKQYLKTTETSLAQYAMLQMGWSLANIKTDKVTTSDFNLEDEQGIINEENYKKLWGAWAGREEEFYIKCYQIVSKVDSKTFKRITGLKREILEVAIRNTQKDFLKNVLPEKLILNPEAILEKVEEGFIRLTLGEVSAKISPLIEPLINAFNGKRTTVEVFQKGYDVLYDITELVDELRDKGILIKA